MNSPTLHIKQLSIGYHNPSSMAKGVILPPINTSLHAGELVALIGRNGIGKSTFLRTIVGLQPAINGMIELMGNPFYIYKKNALSRLVSFVSTGITYIPHMKVFDMVALGRFPHTGWLGKLKMNDKMIIYDALEMVGLRAMAWRNVNTLSDGERQRTLIARALVQDTPIIVLDEPTAYLDIIHKYEVMDLLCQIAHKEMKTVLFSTHDMNIAHDVVDKIWLLTKSELVEGAPEDMVLSAAFEKLVARTSIRFDRISGEFDMGKRLLNTMVVHSKQDIRWIRHALQRFGYKTLQNPSSIPDNTPELLYEMSHNGLRIQYKYKSEQHMFHTIYDLGKYLKELSK
ncbi:MAG: ABC transporter ATP-binding protein [Prevotellaceae bacterium]|jgi:iron complex transport system ATP-binding protein|nr:ABC transporter ATP-binding protein [Prevotellaceae bacterium]